MQVLVPAIVCESRALRLTQQSLSDMGLIWNDEFMNKNIHHEGHEEHKERIV